MKEACKQNYLQKQNESQNAISIVIVLSGTEQKVGREDKAQKQTPVKNNEEP